MGKFFGVSLICLILNSQILADGGFFQWKSEQLNLENTGESPNQRAILIHRNAKETLIIQVKYQGTAEKLAWIIPLPALPQENEIKTISDSVFVRLAEITKPHLYINYGGTPPGKGVSEAGTSMSGSADEIQEKVQIWNQLQVGPYKISLISGQSTEALMSWLSTNGYDFPDKATSIINFYQQKKWYFAAIRIEADKNLSKNAANVASSLPPIQMTFETIKPVFPLRISELTAAPKNEIEIFVISDCSMASENYYTKEIDQDRLQQEIQKEYNQKYPAHSPLLACSCNQPTDPTSQNFEYDYNKFFLKQIAEKTQTTFLMEYAHPTINIKDKFGPLYDIINLHFDDSEQFWMTRLRTIMTPAQMSDDVFFKKEPEHYVYLRIFIQGEVTNHWKPAFLIIPPLFLIFLLLYRRTGSSDRQKFLLFLMILIIAFS